MNRQFHNEFRDVWNEEKDSKRLESLLVLNSSYKDDLGGIINFRPEEIVTERMKDGWNYLKSHKWKYNKETEDLEFEGNGVEGVSYEHNRKLLPVFGV